MGLKLLHLNLHGLIRSHDLELGRDADTGGQTLYVLELIKGLASRAEVEKVDLVTRLIQDRRVSSDYSKQCEFVSGSSNIIRLPFGPKRYLRKELLWPYLDELVDHLVKLLQQRGLPDWIHAHYADAGYVGALVSRRLGIPFVFTAHSLGREKQRRLLAAGLDHDQIEQTYSISRRIDAEEMALAHANLVVTSTKQEAKHQYSRYRSFMSNRVTVIPPGVDSKRFNPKPFEEEDNCINEMMSPFLRNSSLPPLLAISRAVRRKNIPALVEAFGRSSRLRQRHNLVLVLGCRDELRTLERQQREVFQQVFDLVDRYNLYGHVAYPKQHLREQIPHIYRWATKRKGLFVNPALTEPFGLTLLESAGCGLPTVSTDDGGPRDILSRCDNGLLVDVTDLDALQKTLEVAGSDLSNWNRWSHNGIEAISRHFSWDAHVCNYLALMQKASRSLKSSLDSKKASTLINAYCSQLLFFDLDKTLEDSNNNSLILLRKRLMNKAFAKTCGLGVITGRSLQAAIQRYQELDLPQPQVWMARSGTEIYYLNNRQYDKLWERKISLAWDREKISKALFDLKQFLVVQDAQQQSTYKISYLLKKAGSSTLSLVDKNLLQYNQPATTILKCHWYLDVIPLKASFANAIRHISLRTGIGLEDILVIASYEDESQLSGGLTSSLSNCSDILKMKSNYNQSSSFVCTSSTVGGVLDGINHYKFSKAA